MAKSLDNNRFCRYGQPDFQPFLGALGGKYSSFVEFVHLGEGQDILGNDLNFSGRVDLQGREVFLRNEPVKVLIKLGLSALL